MPKLPIPGTIAAAVLHAERMRVIQTAITEYENIVARMRLQQALESQLPQTAPLDLQFDDLSLVYRQDSKRWEQRKFIGRTDDLIIIREPDGSFQPYALTAVHALNDGVRLPRPDIQNLKDAADLDQQMADRVTVRNLANDDSARDPLPTHDNDTFETCFLDPGHW